MREKLKSRTKPYWRLIEKDLHLGYRKGLRDRVWVMRRYLGGGKYGEERIGDADDTLDANGDRVLTFDQAQERVRDRARAMAEAAKLEALGPAITVADALDEYCVAREKREAKSRGVVGIKKDARSRLSRHVLHGPKGDDGTHKGKGPEGGSPDGGERLTALAKKRLATLTSEDLSSWRQSLNMVPASARRTANDFKAALNAAARRYSARLPDRFRDVVKDGFAVETAETPVAREAQILPDADVRALIEAAWLVDAEDEWEGDLARMVLVLAATGARFSQVQRLTVADVQFAERRLVVPASRKGRADKPRRPTPIRVGDDVLEALRPATNGRKGHETLMLRPRWQQVSPIKWEKYERAAWRSAAELTRPWATIIAKAGLAPATVPYALRHSSIVRGLRAGLPVRLVAALHDTSSAMIEAHYAAYIADAMDEIAARAIVPLTMAATVVSIQRSEG